MTETLNLDSMTTEQLRNLYIEFDLHIRLTSKKYGLSVADGKLYKAYSINKLTAMNIRINGSEFPQETPEKYELICDDIYNRMTVKQW